MVFHEIAEAGVEISEGIEFAGEAADATAQATEALGALGETTSALEEAELATQGVGDVETVEATTEAASGSSKLDTAIKVGTNVLKGTAVGGLLYVEGKEIFDANGNLNPDNPDSTLNKLNKAAGSGLDAFTQLIPMITNLLPMMIPLLVIGFMSGFFKR